MSSVTPPNAPTAPRPSARRWRKRWTVIPLALLLAVAIGVTILYVRGTWADTEARNPATVEDGPISQIYLDGGHKQVRCAVVLPYVVDDVWDVLTDYGNYDKMLPYLTDVTAEKENDDEYRMKGQAKSAFLGYWPFEITIHQEKNAAASLPQPARQARLAAWGQIWWDETSATGEVLVNRGGWMLSKHGDKETLLVLSLEAEVQSTPTFVLRNYFRHRLKQVVRAVEQTLARPVGPVSNRPQQ